MSDLFVPGGGIRDNRFMGSEENCPGQHNVGRVSPRRVSNT